MRAVNINDTAWVRLTPEGHRIHREDHDKLFRFYSITCGAPFPCAYEPPTEDAEGWSRWHLWELFKVFGASCYMGGPQVFKENRIRIETEGGDEGDDR